MHEGDGDDSATDPSPSSRDNRRWVLTGIGVALVVAGVSVALWTLLDDGDDDARSAATQGAVAAPPDPGLNISCFAFRDLDRDGSYGETDVPYAELGVDGAGPSGSVTAISNTAGFANFSMRLDDDSAFVDRAGTYTFSARPPDGWALTGAPSEQTVDFEELAGSPVGIVATSTCVPYGLAPDLYLAGPVGSVETVEVDGAAVVVDGDRFVAEVGQGEWSVTVAGADGELARTTTVGAHPVVMSAFVDARDDHEPLPNPVVVGFDDLTTANTLAELPNGYGGLDWTNWVAVHRILYGGPGYVNTSTSGEFVAYNGSGHPATVTSDEPFDFVGALLGVAWPAAQDHDVVVRAWRGDDVVHEDRLELSTAGPVRFDADYRSIDRLEISSSGYWQFVVEDAEFRTG